MDKSVLVIGGGITGINCAKNIANYGFKVYLIEDTPSIGGIMARLDKTFPTNDCSICIEAPQMFDIANNENIKILVNTELKKVYRKDGVFKVKLLKKPTFVDEESCTGCQACVEACPVNVLDDMDGNIGGYKKLISMPFPQAIPNVVNIDSSCRYGEMIDEGGCIGGCEVDCNQCRECSIAFCRQACEKEGKNAILLWQSSKIITLEIMSIIVATGLKDLLPSNNLFGYGVLKNVITSMEFERLMNAGGPTSGKIICPSNGKYAKKIGWIQCVGKEYLKSKGPFYCSKICCMIACKQSIVTKEHDSEVSTYIYYNNIKAYGKNFWEFYKKSINNGVQWVNALPNFVFENSINNSLIVRYENILNGSLIEEELDLLVLSTGLVSNDRNLRLSKILGIELDKNGFFKQKNPFYNTLETSVDGIYVCGGALGPIDISESVSQACAASMKAILKIKSNFK